MFWAIHMRLLHGPILGLLLVAMAVLLGPRLVADRQTVTETHRWEAEVIRLLSVQEGVAEFEIEMSRCCGSTPTRLFVQ
jgi:hypothetical protein